MTNKNYDTDVLEVENTSDSLNLGQLCIRELNLYDALSLVEILEKPFDYDYDLAKQDLLPNIGIVKGIFKDDFLVGVCKVIYRKDIIKRILEVIEVVDVHPEMFFLRFAVREGFRGNGYGQILLNYILGDKSALCNANDLSSPESIHIYKKLGFKDIKKHDGFTYYFR